MLFRSFVVDTLKGKCDGTFLDIGCCDYKDISNTYYLETELNWKGIAIDIDCNHRQGWIDNRPNSIFVCTDATTLDYSELLLQNNMPKIIDYLSLDLEPPVLTLKALEKLFETDYIFRVVTFETDYYRQQDTRDISRKLFESRGYKFMFDKNQQDDFYVYEKLI